MVKFSIFPHKKSPQTVISMENKNQNIINKYKEIALRMLQSGKSEGEVAAYLKSQGLSYEIIDKILAEIIKQATVSPTQLSPTALSSNQYNNLSSSKPPSYQTRGIDVDSLVNTLLEKVLVEIEEVVDLIIEKKYGDLKKVIKNTKESIEKMKGIKEDIENTLEDLKGELGNKTGQLENDIEEIKKSLDELKPKIHALENAFKDTIPNIIDDLRKIEEIVKEKEGGEDVLTFTKKKEKDNEKNEKEEELDKKPLEDKINEMRLDDLIS